MTLDSFSQAFDGHRGSCRATCECGREFYNPDPTWDWDEGELEALYADPIATRLDHSVPFVCFEGREYVYDCTCWHERARRIAAFIDGHAEGIARYLRLEKDRKTREAEAMPTVD